MSPCWSRRTLAFSGLLALTATGARAQSAPAQAPGSTSAAGCMHVYRDMAARLDQ